jgi:ADP-dependent phosphofructokinase/glucokinase
MSTFEQKQIEWYLPELTQLSHDARLELIARLALSLKQGDAAEKLTEMSRSPRAFNYDPEPSK